MDDHHFLIEWLAYHWHVLPLHRLIVAVDPRSRFSITSILDRYRSRKLMDITEWTQKDFMRDRDDDDHHHDHHHKHDITKKFLKRQVVFYAKCLQQLKREKGNNWSWTIFTDTDEYIVPNFSAAPPVRVNLSSLETFDSKTTTIYNLLEQVQQRESVRNNSKMMMASETCIVLPRLRFGTRDSTVEEIQHLVPLNASWNGMDFSTLRWRWRAQTQFGPNQPNRHNGPPKGMVNLQYLQDWMTQYDAKGSVYDRIDVHRPVKALCDEQFHFVSHRHATFVAHHYPGTLQQWTFRQDARNWTRNQNAYQGLAKRARKLDDSIRLWLASFVRTHGQSLAKFLLQGVGQIPTNATYGLL